MKKRGFTMVELMIVIAVIAVLASIIMPKMSGARDKAAIQGCVQNLKKIGIAIEIYSNDNNGNYYPPGSYNYIYPYYSGGCYLTPNYMKSSPVCPTGSNSLGYSYAITHDAANLPAGIPYGVYCYPRSSGGLVPSHNGSAICRPRMYSNGAVLEK